MDEKRHSRLKMWRPRFPERETQCASCPFLEGNDEQFGKVVNRLREEQYERGGLVPPRPAKKRDIAYAREQVRLDVAMRSPDFACHASVYGPSMEVVDPKDWRQCPGATAYARKLEE